MRKTLTENMLDGMFETVVSGIKNFAFSAAESAIPRCATCSDYALPVRCSGCGEYACPDHAWVNRNLQLLCSECSAKILPRHHAPKGRYVDWNTFEAEPVRRKRVNTCWQVLGVAPGSTAAAIKKAFRMQAKACHPDLANNAPAAQRAKLEQRFILLNKALEEALQETEERGQR